MNRLLVLFFLLPFQRSLAQTDPVKDSLLAVFSASKEDTGKVLAAIKLGQYLEYNDLESAKYYYLQAKQLSEKLHYTMGVLKYYANYTAVLNLQARFDSALLLNQQALSLAKEYGNEERIIVAQQNLSATYTYLLDYENALRYLFLRSLILKRRRMMCALVSSMITSV